MSNMLNPQDSGETTRLLIALLIIGMGLVGWQIFFEAPKQHAAQLERQEEAQRQLKLDEVIERQRAVQVEEGKEASLAAVKEAAKVRIESPNLEGAINLRGGRLDYAKLLDYKETTQEGSADVVLLQPKGIEAYFIQFGWLAGETGSGIELPDNDTVWQANKDTLLAGDTVTLHWENRQKLRFETDITLEGAYLFRVNQRVLNQSGKSVAVMPYGYINRTFEGEASEFFILHEGPVGVLDDTLNEYSYEELMEEGTKRTANAKGWMGFSDKYWLTALVPHQGEPFTAQYKGYLTKQGFHRYQADFMGLSREIAAGESDSYETLVFAGAKKLALLDEYAEKYSIPLFDRAVDLGVLYFLTKPLLMLLTGLYSVLGDFGLAILALTFLVKGAMYPLANKSYTSMNEMKRLQPKLKDLKERYGNDKMRFQQEMMGMYKKEKINPASGCLPLLIQIPVFFALYKVLLVTIEMRHANFYSLIEDLSAMDPTNIFTLFGLLEWTPPSMLHLGIMPILMAISMWGQQQLNPKPTDPVQAKVMGLLPWVFMVVLASFPAGLLLYWICSNMLSILQQWSIKTRYTRKQVRKAANDG